MRLLAVLAIAAACGSRRGSEPQDAGTDGGTPFEQPADVEPPAPPAAPVLTPCPPGWTPSLDAEEPDVTTCEPWPGGATADCAADEAQFPGGGCERIGDACPAGEFPEGIGAGTPVRFVKAGAPAGGDGSMAQPFATIVAAVAAADDGDVVALAKGTYDETPIIGKRVTIWGACVAETTVASSRASDTAATLRLTRPGGGVVRSLRVSGERMGVAIDSNSETWRLEDVLIEGAAGVGLLVTAGGAAEASDLVVMDTRVDSTGAFGQGIEVNGASSLTIARGQIERNHTVGMLVAGAGSTIWASDVGVRRTLPGTSGYGRGVETQAGGLADLARAVVEESVSDAISLRADGSLSASDLVVRDTRAPDGSSGVAVSVGPGATASLDRALLDRSLDTGAAAYDGGTISAHDCVVRDTRPASDGLAGFGLLLAGDGATAQLGRVLILRSTSVGAIAKQGGRIVAADLEIRDIQAEVASGDFGLGLDASLGGRIEIERALVSGAGSTGVRAIGAGSELHASDLAIRDVSGVLTGPLAGSFGYGIELLDGAIADLSRVAVERAHGVAFMAAVSGTRLVASDVSATDTLSRAIDGTQGYGASIQEGAHAELLRARFVRSRRTGVFVPYDSVLEAQDLVVEDTLDNECFPDLCAEGGGFGMSVLERGIADVRRFRISRSSLCGVQVAFDGALDLHDGEVSENPVGANVQVEGYDVARLQDGVVYRDNAQNLDASSLPVPTTAALPE